MTLSAAVRAGKDRTSGWQRALWLSQAAGLLACQAPAEETPPLIEECRSSPQIRTAAGETLVLRGVNVSAEMKWSHDHLPRYDSTDWQTLRRDYGMNTIRLLIFWQAVEPYPGWIDRHYLEAIRRTIEAAAEAGLFTIIDMHQDVYGEGFGEAGAPRWTCDESLYARYRRPQEWYLGYVQSAVGECFDALYALPQRRAAFAGAWAEVAEALRGSPGLLAYDLLNEPFWGSSSVAQFERQVAPHFYREVIDTLRAVDDQPWVGIEPAVTANVGIAGGLTSPRRPRLLSMPHMYPRDVELEGEYRGDLDQLRRHLRSLCESAQRLNAPMLIGELGVRGSVIDATGYLRDLYDLLDEEHASALFWHLGRDGDAGYGLWRRDGSASPQGAMVARPYIERYQGRGAAWAWYEEEGIFVAEWTESSADASPTLIALPARRFADDVAIDLQPPSDLQRLPGRLKIQAVGGARRLVIGP